MRCPECEKIDHLIFETTNLYFHFPTENSFSKFARFVGSEDYPFDPLDNSIRVTLKHGQFESFVEKLTQEFGEQERANTKVLSVDADTDNGEIKIEDFTRIVTLEQIVACVKGNWLIDLLEKRRFTSHFQPIFHSDGKSVFGYEALFRGLDDNGGIIAPGQMFPLATSANLLFQLDLAARCSAVDAAHEQGLQDSKLFINFNPSSIYDPSYCLRETTKYISERGISPDQIIFEVVESHYVASTNHLRGILTFYRKSGFEVALDDIGSGYSGLNMMQDLKPGFIKIDMELIRGVDQDDYRQNIIQNLITMCHANEGKVICEGIETEQEFKWLQDQGADYLQGFYLAKPSATFGTP